MNHSLIAEANMRVPPGMPCIHVGDFCMASNSQCKAWQQQLVGNWIFIKGNHDKNNGVKPVAGSLFTRIGHYRVFVAHVPYYYNDPEDRVAKYHLDPRLIFRNGDDVGADGFQVGEEGAV